MTKLIALVLLIVLTAPASAHDDHGQHHCHFDTDDAQRCH
jgi:hypothetical protein